MVQVAHGLAEHSARYDRFARALNGAGYTVHATDHRGHGASIAGTPGDFGAAGFEALIADVAAYGASLRGDLPLFLVAHSMGSFAAQSVLLAHSERYAGVVLSGSTALDLLAAGMAEAEGPVGLEAFNTGFEHRTGYEWLSRDEAEVDRYVADPLCGFDVPDETIRQFRSRRDTRRCRPRWRASGPTCRSWSSRGPTTRWPAADSPWRCSASATGTPGWST